MTTIHRCFLLSVHNLYNEVAMVTIQEVLSAVISGIEISKTASENCLFAECLTALMIAGSQ